MIRNYFRQAWTLVRQHKLFTGIYVVGTGLSIALVMTLFIIFYVKFGPVYTRCQTDKTLPEGQTRKLDYQRWYGLLCD